ncbi:hypothetical protein ACLI4Q_03895 [Natrialbaceae archaeon A-CW1-1]
MTEKVQGFKDKSGLEKDRFKPQFEDETGGERDGDKPLKPVDVRTKDFHVVVEQEGERKLVPAGGAISFPPRIEKVHILFRDSVEYRVWEVPFSGVLEPSNGETSGNTIRVHRFREEGNSEWNERWAVEVAFEEKPDGWLSPKEVRYEGLAMYASVGLAFEQGVVEDPEVFESLV